MYKGIIASDLHLDSHPKRTPTRDFRLNQSYTIIENIISLARKEGATDFLWLAGDIVDKHDHDSTTHHVVKECLQKLADGFDEVYFILGNHDILNRSVSAESRDGDSNFSYITLYKPSKFVYADRIVIEREGLRIGFRNHSSAAELDLDFLGGEPVDILVSHISRAYSDHCEYDIQRYPEDLVRGNLFSGHIHQSRVMGKDVSIGVGQKCSISDDTPQVVVLEMNQGNYGYKHQVLDPEHKQMDIVPDLSISSDFYDEATNTYHVAKKDEEKIIELVAESLKGGSALETLSGFVETKGIKQTFDEIREHTNLDDSGPLNMYFQINSLEIHNLRSIKSQRFTFKPGDFIRIDGETGSGKSTVFLALQYALTGELGGPKAFFIHHGEKEMWVELELSYSGHNYRIKRGTGESFVEEDGIRLELGNKNDTKKKITEILPFIKALGFMCFDRESHIVKGGSSSENSEKLQAFCRIIGLTEIDAYHKTAEMMYKPVEQKLTSEKAVYELKFAGVSEKRERLETLKDLYGNLETVTDKLAWIEIERARLQKNLQDYQKDQALRKQHQEYIDRVRAEESRLEGYMNQLSEFRDPQAYQNLKEGLVREIQNNQAKITALSSDRDRMVTLETQLRTIWDSAGRYNKELQTLKPEDPKYCSSYGVVCPIVTDEMRQKKFQERQKELQDTLMNLKEEYDTLNSEYQEIMPRMSGYKELDDRDKDLKSQLYKIDMEIQSRAGIKSKIDALDSELSRLKSNLPGELGDPIELEPDIMDKLNRLSDQKKSLEEMTKLDQELRSLENESGDLEDMVIGLQRKLDDLDEFLKLTKPNGMVYTKILDNIVKSFSNGRYRYEVESNRNRSGIEIRAYIKDSKGHETPYGIGTTGSSSGEGVMIDLHFLSCLVSIASPGLMIFDEFLSPLDINLIDDGIQRVREMKANLTFIVAHQANLRQEFNRVFNCTKNNETSEYEET